MGDWGQWRANLKLAAIYLVILEATSWLPAPSGTACVVNPADYGPYFAQHNECPTFHVFLIKFLACVADIFGKPEWIIAIFHRRAGSFDNLSLDFDA